MPAAMLTTLAVALLATGAWAGNSPPRSNSVDSLDWLVGHWQGEAFGGVCEEVWSPASAGTMVGTFKLFTNSTVQFYELMTITPGPEGPDLRVKHFNADLTGREEKERSVMFPFLALEPGKLTLDGIVYERTGPDSLVITVSMHSKDGSTRDEVIRCVRIGD